MPVRTAMKHSLIRVLFVSALLAAMPVGQAAAGRVHPDRDFSVNVPDGWQTLSDGIRQNVPPSVSSVLDCVDDVPSELKMVGWKLGENDKVEGAFCITYKKGGFGKVRQALKESKGKDRETLVAKYMDSVAAHIKQGYENKRGMRVAMTGELLEAGQDFVLVLEGRVKGPEGQRARTATAYLHGDGQVTINGLYALDAPDAVLNALDAIPVTLQWN